MCVPPPPPVCVMSGSPGDAVTRRDSCASLSPARLRDEGCSLGDAVTKCTQLPPWGHHVAPAFHNPCCATNRANLYTDAGADASFIQSPRSDEELEQICKRTYVGLSG